MARGERGCCRLAAASLTSPPPPPAPVPLPRARSENSLSGTLPPEWGPGWSDSMELLALQSNGGITGPLPASWAEMAKLRDLRLLWVAALVGRGAARGRLR